MRVGEVAVIHIYFPCYFIHLFQVQSHQLIGIGLNLIADSAVDLSQRRKTAILVTFQQKPSKFCDEVRCVVAAGQHHAKVQVIQSILSSHSQLRSRARHFAGSPRSPDFYFLCVDSKRADRFENGYKVHHLGQARHFPFLVAAVRPNGLALLHVVYYPALGRDLRREFTQGCKFLGLIRVTSAGFLGIWIFPAWIERVLRCVSVRPPGFLRLVAVLGLQKLIILIIEVAFALESRTLLLDSYGLAQNGWTFIISDLARQWRQATGIHLHNILRNSYYIFL